MVNVCILIRVQAGKAKQAFAALQKVAEIKQLFAVFGRYDFVAFAIVPDYKAATRLARKINALQGVKSTESLLEC